ncbi:MAG: hypothetical protein HYU97_08155 [Deltaproteobacteria bacterium]|nr:hypothetical protein [Deltaproteobacteria bacterium]
MGLAEQFVNLGEDFLGAFDARVNFLGKNIVDVKNLKLDTHKLQNKFAKEQKAMGNKLRADLGAFVDDLTGTVEALQHKFQKQQRTVHQDCTAAHRAWEKVEKTMQAKRRNLKNAVNAAKQKASRSK